MKRTTVGRFWGYTSVFIALGVSLAGNVTAASLHGREPDWVDLGFAGIPPLAAFLSIEIVNHNPWDGTDWGPRVRKVLLGLVAPASAVVSFIHLVSVVVADRETGLNPEGVITWITAVLTALLIDGLMFGGTAALLLPKAPAKVKDPASKPAVAAIEAYPNWRAEIARQFASLRPMPQADLVETMERTREQVVTPVAKKREKAPQPGRKRFPPREHPLWGPWSSARARGEAWTADAMVKQVEAVVGKTITAQAASEMIRRWERIIDNDLSKV